MKQVNPDSKDTTIIEVPTSPTIPLSQRRRLSLTYMKGVNVVALMYKYDITTDTFEQEKILLDLTILRTEQENRTDADREELIRYLLVFNGVTSQLERFGKEVIMYVSEIDKFYLLSYEERREWSDIAGRIDTHREVSLMAGVAHLYNYLYTYKTELSDKLITSIKIQSKNIKVKLNTLKYNASEIRYYTDYATLMCEIELSNGATIRRVKAGYGGSITNSVLHAFLDRNTGKFSDGIWSYKERDKYRTIKVLAKSMELYISILSKEQHIIVYHDYAVND